MAKDYPWYELVDDNSLEQGDIFVDFPVIEPLSYEELNSDPPPQARIKRFDIIIMTQSCDLVSKDYEDIIICPHWSIDGHIDIATTKGRKEFENYKKGRIPRYLLLNKYESDHYNLGYRIVDFGRIFTCQKQALLDLAKTQRPRLRLRPPYREHLAQGFARFFMRVGLPQDIKLE